MKQTVVPIVLIIFTAIVAIIALILLFQYLNRRLSMKTVKSIIDKHNEISPELIQAIIVAKQSQFSDFRKGSIYLASSFATVIFSFIMAAAGYNLAQNSLLGMAAFPFMIGIAYIGFCFFSLKNK